MKKNYNQWSRREFVGSVARAGATLLLNPLLPWADDEVDPRVAAIVRDTIGVDTHNHIDVPFNASELPAPAVDLAGDLKKSGLSAICMTFSVDRPELRNPGEAYDRFKTGLTAMDQYLEKNRIKRALNMADLRAAHKRHEPTVIQSVEGGHFLEGHIERLEEAYKRGLRHLGLLHDNDASPPLGDVFTNQPRWGGLTAFGAEVIRECNRLGILIDLSHADNETVDAALKLTKKPVIVSHTGLNTRTGDDPNMAKMMMPRLISKEQAKIVANTGGVIGVWTHLAETTQQYAENIRAMVEVAGIDHVCIGTDTKLTPSYRPAGGKPREERVGERTNRAWADQKAGFYYAFVEALLKTGFNKDEIGKIGGGNFCRIFEAATQV